MGIVHRAVHEPSGRPCALKVLPSLVGLDPAAVARFHREAEAAARISHPGIVAVHSFGEQDGVHWLAMDYVSGPSLDRLLGDLAGRDPATFRGTFFEETGLCDVVPGLDRSAGRSRGVDRYVRSCLWMLAGAAEALAVAHDAGVVHRDVKPSNLLVGRGGRLVIADFGLARNVGDDPLTRTGDVVGTPCYMAPEQARGDRDVGPAADVYGLGATLFELLTLAPPFEGAHAGDILRRILDEEPTPLRLLHPEVPRSVAELVERCLEKDPADRPADAGGLAIALRSLAEGGSWTPPKRGARRWLSRAVMRHSRPLAATATLSAAVVGSLAVAGIIRMREAEQDGSVALAGARVHLARGEFAAAEKAYGRAEALLGLPAVAEARLRDRDECFEGLYAAGRHDELVAWLDSWPSSVRDEAHRRCLARARGLGGLVCEVPGNWPVGAVRILAREVPSVAPGADGPEGIEVLPGASIELPVGHWRLCAEGNGVDALARQTLEVDVVRDVQVRVGFLPVHEADRPEADAALLLDPMRGVPVWLDRQPWTVSRHRQLLAALDDPDLRAELTPDDRGVAPVGLGAAADRPVLGLEPAQARVLAMLAGAHLAEPELLAAAPGGAAAGGQDPDRVAWLARFAEPQVEIGSLRMFDARAAAAAASGIRRARRFAIDTGGRVGLTLWARTDEQGRVRLDLDGWRRRDVPQVVGLEGGVPMPAQLVDLADGGLELRLARPGVTVRVDLTVVAVEALQGDAGRLELDFPAGVPGVAELFAVQLATGAAIRDSGALRCVARQSSVGSLWEVRRDPGTDPGPRLVLDVDGAWTERWPSAARVRSWLAAAGGESGELRAVVALGDVVAIDRVVGSPIDESDDVGRPVPGWRERVSVDRGFDPPTVIARFPARRPDTGVLAAGGYRHEGLGIVWSPEGAGPTGDVALERLAEHWLPVQVRAMSGRLPGVRVLVTALPVELGRSPAASLFRLSGGTSGDPRRLRDAWEEPVAFGSGIELVESHALLFVDGQDAVRHERWLHLRKAGRAELLWREVVQADGRQDALESAESAAVQAWFERLRAGLAY